MKKRIIALLLALLMLAPSVVSALDLSNTSTINRDSSASLKGQSGTELASAVSFDGYSVRLWDEASVRASFSPDTSFLDEIKSEYAIFELGTVIAPADAEGALVQYDTSSMLFVTSDPSYVQTVDYDGFGKMPEKISAALPYDALASDDDRDARYVFKAYIGTVDLSGNAQVVFFDATSDIFGASVSASELYDYFLVNGQGISAYPAVRDFEGEEKITLHASLEKDLTSALASIDDATEAKEAIPFLSELATQYYDASLATGCTPYDKYSNAYTALQAYNAQSTQLKALKKANKSLASALTNIESALNTLTANLSEEKKQEYAELFLTGFAKKHTDMTAYAESVKIDSVLKMTYYQAVTQAKQALAGGNKQTKTLNGTSLESYAIYADTDNVTADYLGTALAEEFGLIVPRLPSQLLRYSESGTNAIFPDYNRAHDGRGEGVLSFEDGTLTLYGNTENGVYHAAARFLKLLEEDDNVMLEGKMISRPGDAGTQYYAVDSFFNEDGTLNTDSTEPLTIVCIGGSLTELGGKWVEMVKNYFAARFPNRPVTIYNAGVGGTGSQLGSARFGHDVLDLKPDLVIIEFSVNDGGTSIKGTARDKTVSQKNFEGMIYQCLQAEKVPGVIYAHTPQAADKESTLYQRYLEQVEYKGEIAEHYGISVVDIYDYFFRQYEIERKKSPDLTYNEYIADIYNENSDANKENYGIYDVHPKTSGRGYVMYAEAFIEAFDRDLASMLTRLPHKNICCTKGETSVKESYNYVPQNSDRITYDGTWDVYTAAKPYDNSDANVKVNVKRYGYPFMSDGLRRAYKQSNAALEIKTTAQEISFLQHGAVAGCEAVVYVGDVRKGSVTVKTPNQQPFQTSVVNLGNPEGKEVTVRVVVNPATDTDYAFQFGYIIEGFTN